MCLGKLRTPTKNLRCAYWNINGHKSQIIGDKLCDSDFLSSIDECDILGLSELHSNEKVCIPGFKLLKQKIRQKKFRGPKIAGGIAIFVREGMDHFVQVVPNDNENSIWIRLAKSI